MEFSRQEYWSELPFPSPKNLPLPGIESRSPKLQAILYDLSRHGFCKQQSIYLFQEKKNVILERRLIHSILLGSEVNEIDIIIIMKTLGTYSTKNRYIGRMGF